MESHDKMEKVVLGRSGLEVSVIGWGGAGTSGDPSTPGPRQAAPWTVLEPIWEEARRWGCNFIDTAPSYGHSEDLIGEQLSHRRDEFLIATKSHPVDADQTLRDIENSLRRLRIDAIDLFYAPHGCWDEERFANCFKKGGVIEGGLKAKERGLARHLAFSFDYFQSLDIKRLRALIDTDVFEVVQFPYSLVCVEPIDEEILPFAREKKMGTIANFPTIGGLTGREWGIFYPLFQGLVDTPGQATLLGILAHPDIDCVLSKFSSVARAAENCRAGAVLASLSAEQRAQLRQRIEALGRVRFLQRQDCPPAPPGVNFRWGMIYFDLFTRFGYGGARRQVEQFVKQLQAHEEWEWDPSVRELVEAVKRSCPVFLEG